ncbi:MAG: DUF1189 domain-containing protein [Bacteroides sp.]|nr:DUF1189 domain-containing protein [Bacteroides sp.]MCM1550205.1 DUF1189 domain-containing protein [Clostridium sp.]
MKEKISFTEQIRIALSKPLWYKSLFQQSLGKHICYFLVLILLITVIQFGIPVAAYLQSMGGLKNLLLEGIPDFQLEQGELQVEIPVELERSGVRLVIDTSVDAYTQEDAIAEAEEMDTAASIPVVYMLSRTNMVCNMTDIPFDFAEMDMVTLNNQELYNMAPAFLVFYSIMVFIRNVLIYMLSALFFALFGWVMNKTLGLNLKFGQIYVIALYAKSIQILLESILQVAGFVILYYIGSIVGIFITCNYMTRGMSSLLLPTVQKQDDESDRPKFFL